MAAMVERVRIFDREHGCTNLDAEYKLIGRDFFRVDHITKNDGIVEIDFAFVGHKEMFDDKPLVEDDPQNSQQFMQDVEGYFRNNPRAQDDFSPF
jgi:hypothetical protein